MKVVTKAPSLKTRQMLESLERAVANTLERKRRLGHYTVTWKDGKVVLEGEDVPDTTNHLSKPGSESSAC